MTKDDGQKPKRKPITARPVKNLPAREDRLKSILKRFPKTIERLSK